METSILKSTKKILGISEDYTAFDLDILTHINSVFSVLHQMGVGPDTGFFVEDDSSEWEEFFGGSDYSLNMIKTYVYLKVRGSFDPPSTSFVLEALNKQIEEYEWRISTNREWSLNPVDPMTEEEEEDLDE